MARSPAASPFTPDPVAEHRRLLGQRGEDMAARHLTRRGLVLLDRNWRCEAGEIDLVLRDGQVLVICEVKTRTSARYGSPLEAVDPRKADRVHRLVRRWAAEHDHSFTSVRLDVIAVVRPRRGRAELRHLTGVS